MTAPTLQRAWTEAEIREAIAGLDPQFDLPDAFWREIGAIGDSDAARVRGVWDEDFYPDANHPGTLWADLRKSEADELAELVGDVVRAARARFVQEVTEGLVAVALRFDEAHPDAPRGHWPHAAKLAVEDPA